MTTGYASFGTPETAAPRLPASPRRQETRSSVADGYAVATVGF